MNSGVRADLTCEDVEHILDLYLDGEVDDVERREIEMHLLHCADCAELEAKHRHTRARLRALAESTSPSDEFKERLAKALEDDARNDQSSDLSGTNAGKPVWRQRRWLGLAGGTLAAALLAVSAVSIFYADQQSQPTSQNNEVLGMTSVRSPVVDEAIAWHERNVPVEVTGPDSDRVRSWFEDEGMVDFDMTIPNLGRRATLLGGRLSHVRYHEAGYLLYEVGGEKLTVLIFGAEDSQPPGAAQPATDEDSASELLVDNHSGHTVVIKNRGELTYTFTSDMNEDRLVELVEHAFN
jgi:anti-sigma factor RsiW